MNETTQTLSDLPEYKQEFAEAIIDIVENKKRKDVPLANIDFRIKDFENHIPILQNIAKRQRISGEEWQKTVRSMLGLYCSIGEVIRLSGYYKLTEHGILHRRLEEKLESTP